MHVTPPMPAPLAEDATALFVKTATLNAQASAPPAAQAATGVITPATAPAPSIETADPTEISAPAQVVANVLMFRPRQRAA